MESAPVINTWEQKWTHGEVELQQRSLLVPQGALKLECPWNVPSELPPVWGRGPSHCTSTCIHH